MWVVCGNVPSLYLTTDCCPAPKDVFENYCDLAEQWCDGTLPELDFSVKDIPDTEVKDELRQRTAALREAVCRHIFRPFEKEAEVSSNPQRHLAEECIGSYIRLHSGYLAEDLRFAGIHDAVAICKVEATPISDVLDLADQMEVKRLRVINGNLSNLTSNDSIESLIWASTEALPESFDLSSWTHLRRLSLRASHSEVVKIASPQLQELTLSNDCRRGTLHVDMSALTNLRSVILMTNRIECLVPENINTLCLRDLSSKETERLPFCNNLQELVIEDGTITDLSFLSRYPSLKKLRLYGLSKLTNLEGLCGLPLRELRIDTCNSVTDFTALCSLPLLRLFIRRHAGKPLTDIQFIAGISTLEMCGLDAKVTDSDLTPLTNLKCCDYKGILTDERRAQNRQYLVAHGCINTWYDRRRCS